MSLKVNINNLSDTIREKITKDLTIKIVDVKASKYSRGPAKYVYPFELIQTDVYLPFYYGVNHVKLPRPNITDYTPKQLKFTGSLRPNQKEIKNEALQFLNDNGCVVIACYPGCGKTSMSIYISTVTKMKTLIILNRLVLMEQWESSINKFCPDAKVECIKPTKKKISEDADFYIINAINMPKYGREFFQDMGTVIVDEAHLIISEVLSQSLQYVTPKYLIGLSATPYRPDGMDVLMDLYFSPNKIIRNLYRKHTVYKIVTKFEPEVELDRNGKINWGKVLESLCCNTERNEMIINIVKQFPERNFLILSKRIDQAEYLLKRLQEEKESVTSLIKSQQEFDKEARVLIGTTGKVGVGFDHDKLDALILASDLEEYFIQYLGRVFRREDVEPIVFDILDNHKILQNHFRTRQKVYKETGGEIKLFT